MAQLMPLPLTVSCSSKIQIGFTFLVPAYPGCPGKEAVKGLLHTSCLLQITLKKHLSFLLHRSIDPGDADVVIESVLEDGSTGQ